MDTELLSALDYIQREKGIERAVIISAIEIALLSAARKRFGNNVDLQVTIAPNTGVIVVLKDSEEVQSASFGRIAAQTAKQIITQKIREAESEVLFENYQKRIGDITNGIVHRFERGNVIVDLGKAEGVLFHREMLPNEKFKQGERVHALILDVKKTNRVPQIILSRTNPGFVKRLFELEVPEIYEGIVEIKDIARLAGERTKVAVCSKEEKVDCVGACVGVRGSRIKNIVRELQSEKVDIVRWSEDIVEYVKAALSPAKILQTDINLEEKRIDIVVDPEYLSVAIGKHGQNVRLASKLLNWSINVCNRKQAGHEQRKNDLLELVVPQEKFQLSGIGDKIMQALITQGYNNLSALSEVSVEDLIKVKGVGKKRAEQIIAQVKETL
ncbi:MAG: transcription termination factor NusA [Candidatus Omnitrophota bacterium]|nr:MAG: transcription termination factor NusA [Candidatus Omnitrophota bacterium]